ncbi:MAG: serine/threonine-protein kinase [Marmoricola sp.]
MTIDQSTLLDDRYRLDEHIGTGGSADVWRGTDVLLDRLVAVKVLREVSDPTQRQRFIDEARTLAGLNHAGLVVLLDAGILGERPYLVMTLADDATLASRIASGPIGSDGVRAIGIQVANALAYAHERGIVHRDVKPSNVLLCGDGRALLADFGIARLVGSTEHHTRTGDAIGSPAYLAPEQVAGDELTPAVDIYSFGLVLLEALTAERAFPGTPIEAALARLNAAPPMPPDLDPGWRALLARMTHRVPENRPTAREVVEELARGEQTLTPIATRRRWSKPAAYLGLVALLLVVAFLVVRPGGGGNHVNTPGAPVHVPARYQPALTHLHDAVNGPEQ